MLKCPICHQGTEKEIPAEEIIEFVLAREIPKHFGPLVEHITTKVEKNLKWEQKKITEENIRDMFYKLFC